MVIMETLASSHSNRTVTRELETKPCIAINRDDDIDSSRMQDENNRLRKDMIELRGTRMQDENSRLRTEITELRERLRRFEQLEQERLSLRSRAGNRWHHHQSYTQHHHDSNEADSSDMSQSTLTDQDLDIIHDENLNGHPPFVSSHLLYPYDQRDKKTLKMQPQPQLKRTNHRPSRLHTM